MRYSRKFIEARFSMAMDALGVPHGETWAGDEQGKCRANVGTYFIDHNSVYGGYQICMMFNEGGGRSCPFGMERHNAGAFVAMLTGIIESARILKAAP